MTQKVKGVCIPTTLLFMVMFLSQILPTHSHRHIVFIVADDLGWNDVGFHNVDMITPNIDKLANAGVILNSSYVQPVCTPSRNAFMTGLYSFKTGLQHGVIEPSAAECASMDRTLLPEKLKDLGYATHIVGKWHLGSCNWNCTPTYRGFDSFLGFYNGMEDYYTKMVLDGEDFRHNERPIKDTEYSSFIFEKRAVQIIQNHDKGKPLFLYLPFQSVHSPVQAPERFSNMYPNIQTTQRKTYCGMVSALDEAIGNVVDALENAGLMDDTLIIFTSDNGGIPTTSGNNFPLRGAKSSVFEGGTRAAGFLYGYGLDKAGYTYDGLIHAVDWFPTIIAAAGGSDIISTDNEIDGINQWDVLRSGKESLRNEIVYNLDNDIFAEQGHAAIRVGDYKLIQGYPGPFSDWYQPDHAYRPDLWGIFEGDIIEAHIAEDRCSYRGVFKGEGLYNLKDDPNEYNDISKENPQIVEQLKARLDYHRQFYVEPKPKVPNLKSNPVYYGGFWSPGWC